MRYLILLILLMLFSGCINKTGISDKYYNDCHTVYDMYGNYKTVCPNNIYNIQKTKNKDCLQCN